MTRATQRNKIIKVSSIFAVNIRPLDKSWSLINFATGRALGWVALISANPLMKSNITHPFSLPFWVPIIFQKCGKFFIVFGRIVVVPLSIAKLFSPLRNFGYSYFRITLTRAIVSRFNLRGRPPQDLSASETFCFNHRFIVATI